MYRNRMQVAPMQPMHKLRPHATCGIRATRAGGPPQYLARAQSNLHAASVLVLRPSSYACPVATSRTSRDARGRVLKHRALLGFGDWVQHGGWVGSLFWCNPK